jgi:DNA-binding MarR family transcriptional regulator
MVKAREKELREYGIALEQAAVCFYILAIGDKATPAQLSRWMLREPHTISAILSRMEQKGLVRKVKDLGGNQLRVTLTDRGYKNFEQSTKKESIHRIMSCLSESEYQQITSCLIKMQEEALKQLKLFDRPPFPP